MATTIMIARTILSHIVDEEFNSFSGVLSRDFGPFRQGERVHLRLTMMPDNDYYTVWDPANPERAVKGTLDVKVDWHQARPGLDVQVNW